MTWQPRKPEQTGWIKGATMNDIDRWREAIQAQRKKRELKGGVSFAATPSDALQCFLDMKASQEELMRAIDDGRIPKELYPELFGFHRAEDRRDWRALINGIPVYHWSTHTASLVRQASATYPLESEQAISWEQAKNRAERPPGYWPRVARAFCVFSAPVLTCDVDGVRSPLSALMWANGYSLKHQQFWITLVGVVWGAGTASPVFWHQGGAGDSDARLGDPNDTFKVETMQFIKWACTASMFIEQELLAAPAVTPQRAFRKRAEQNQVFNPLHVVQLRKTVQPHHGSESESHIEWQCRWLVRGHWRRQWFPSRQDHAPVWIEPYIKGPEDKPFAEHKDTVFAVHK